METSTELLAEIIARPHLKTPRSEIIQITKDAHLQRLKFLKRLRQGPLAPVDVNELVDELSVSLIRVMLYWPQYTSCW